MVSTALAVPSVAPAPAPISLSSAQPVLPSLVLLHASPQARVAATFACHAENIAFWHLSAGI